jgi:single-strand selective monofunctional uracil DNA glycosylase
MTAPVMATLDRLARRMARLEIEGAAWVYSPLVYARAVVERYVEAFGQGKKEILLLGMNPGPHGMGQTGVPFGEVTHVRGWMGLDGAILQPRRVHPKRPIEGFACKRSEVSGARLWGAIAARHPDPRDFFAYAFVVNYCPLMFLDDGARNVTPDALKKADRVRIEAPCDEALREICGHLAPEVVIGVGNYATAAAERALGGSVRVVGILHPSPANPKANTRWLETVRATLAEERVRAFV